MKRLLIFLIRIYQKVFSKIKPVPTCRFYPTCSNYALQAVTRFGAIKGGYLAVRRILRCHPFYEGAFFDPVPEDFSFFGRRADKNGSS